MDALQRILVAALLCVATAGCTFGEFHFSDPLGREVSLEESQNQYTLLVRWSEFDRASSYVDPERREDFLASMPSFRHMRFTEFESGPVDIDEDGNAVVKVTYYGYTVDSPFEVPVLEIQEWYRDGGTWLVRPRFSSPLLTKVGVNR
ncbi:MAG: hypothetical protein MJE66_02610 [Proteobacteria bacterium]|nr:hypothetical protein [Pseudomonadota bacterium]